MATYLPIVTFHAIDDRPAVISFSPGLFERSMAQLHKCGYRAVSLVEVIKCVQLSIPFPERALAITFDDGYQSVYQQAFPVLQRYGFSATIFLTVGKDRSAKASDRLPHMGERSMLSWGEIREMQQCGIEFGAHTITHPDLTRLSPKLAENEICDSKAIIENALSAPVASFAYPYGRYDDCCREIVSHHFLGACSDRLGLVGTNADLYAMERVDTYYLRSEKLLSLMPSVLFPLYVKARNIPRRIRRAVRVA